MHALQDGGDQGGPFRAGLRCDGAQAQHVLGGHQCAGAVSLFDVSPRGICRRCVNICLAGVQAPGACQALTLVCPTIAGYAKSLQHLATCYSPRRLYVNANPDPKKPTTTYTLALAPDQLLDAAFEYFRVEGQARSLSNLGVIETHGSDPFRSCPPCALSERTHLNDGERRSRSSPAHGCI